MIDINPMSVSPGIVCSPVLVSEPDDFRIPPLELRLRQLLQQIPAEAHPSASAIAQNAINSAVRAMQDCLVEAVSTLSGHDSFLAGHLVASSSGLNTHYWLNTRGAGKGDMKHLVPCPVRGVISTGLLKTPPSFGMCPLEPSVTVDAGAEEEVRFYVSFTVADQEDMRLLFMLMEEAGEVWSRFERAFGVVPFTSIPLPAEAQQYLGDAPSVRDYAAAFLQHIVSGADPDRCLESFDLQFGIDSEKPLYISIAGAALLLGALVLFQASVAQPEGEAFFHAAKERLESAISLAE